MAKTFASIIHSKPCFRYGARDGYFAKYLLTVGIFDNHATALADQAQEASISQRSPITHQVSDRKLSGFTQTASLNLVVKLSSSSQSDNHTNFIMLLYISTGLVTNAVHTTDGKAQKFSDAYSPKVCH